MKNLLLIISFVILQVGAVFAQKFKLDLESQEQFVEREQEKLNKIILCEQEKTANQDDYDVKYYSLDLIPDPATEILTGKVEIIGEVVALTLDHVELNLIGNMNVTDVYLLGSPDNKMAYTHDTDTLALGNILSVNLDSVYLQGQVFSFVVEYNGTPLYGYGFDSYRGSPMIWTLSQPYGARAWWPCKDLTSDKADSVDIRVTVPNDLIVASNGALMEKKQDGDVTTYWWHEKYPIIPYLVSLAIHPYTVTYDDYIYNNGLDTMKIHFYMFPDHANQLEPFNALVKDMIAFFDDIYGEYPFIDEKYGHADFLGGGAMEHQTCTSFSFWDEWVFAHELSHQWWGDMITCDSWHHIWLNEGFACYSEILWFEHAYGHDYAINYLLNARTYLGPGTVYVEDPLTEPILILSTTYNKACWVLHMLRHVVGDSAFSDILKTYYASRHRYKTATTADFQTICEQVSGQNLDYFFHQWIYESGHPVYEYAWGSENLGGGNYKVIGYIDQVQTDGPLFMMPLDITVLTVDSTLVTQTIFVDEQGEIFEIVCNSEPNTVILDIGYWLLKEVIEVSAPRIVYQNFMFDDSTGNGNGHWDEGETIQITVELMNYGIDAENVTVTLETDNSDITIQNPTLTYGNMDHRQIVSNDSEPYILSLSETARGGISQLMLRISGSNNYSTVDNFTIDVGTPNILLVDDDNGSNYEQFVAPLLRETLLYSAKWDNSISNIKIDSIDDFNFVIWITGDDRETSLTSDEQAIITTYLNNGGKLLISGQNIGYDLIEVGSSQDSIFYTTYLSADYIRDTEEPITLIGTPGDPITDRLFINFTGSYGGAGNQNSPDVIAPIDPAVQIFKYTPSLEGAGIRYYNESNGAHVIYLPFGIEGISGPYENSASLLLKNCLAWLSGTTDVISPYIDLRLPHKFSLEQNYPNPFNPETIITYKIPSRSDITLTVYNVLGQKVRVLDQGVKNPGVHQVTWDSRDDRGRDVAGGLYFYRLKGKDISEVKKMVLMR